jgi:hypothetical protein
MRDTDKMYFETLGAYQVVSFGDQKFLPAQERNTFCPAELSFIIFSDVISSPFPDLGAPYDFQKERDFPLFPRHAISWHTARTYVPYEHSSNQSVQYSFPNAWM